MFIFPLFFFFGLRQAFLFAVYAIAGRPFFHLCVIVTPFASEEKEESGCEQKAMLTQRLQGCNVNLRQVASVLGQRHALV